MRHGIVEVIPAGEGAVLSWLFCVSVLLPSVMRTVFLHSCCSGENLQSYLHGLACLIILEQILKLADRVTDSQSNLVGTLPGVMPAFSAALP